MTRGSRKFKAKLRSGVPIWPSVGNWFGVIWVSKPTAIALRMLVLVEESTMAGVKVLRWRQAVPADQWPLIVRDLERGDLERGTMSGAPG